jgi:outer membrane autotransporter protein
VLTVSRSITNTGSILPGSSPGVLTVKGDYVQGQDGELSVEVNRYEVGSGFDRLNVSGSAALDGTLNIIFESDFAPNTGDTFQVLQHGSRSGTFQTVNSSRSGGSRPVSVEVDYTSTATTVRVTAPTASPRRRTSMETARRTSCGGTPPPGRTAST